MVAVVDYGMGNLRSVAKAIEAAGAEVRVTARAEDIRAASHIVLPGVGAFGQCVSNLRATSLVDVLEHEVLQRGKPFLGICLGMQLLVNRSEESGPEHAGLGWLAGAARRFESAPNHKVPHMGWNDVLLGSEADMFRGIRHPVFYFLHSYYVEFADPRVVAATCEYGPAFAAAAAHENIWAVQFHPEKSQQNGLRFLMNFLSRS